MGVNFALHGLDRMGRMFLRAWFERDAGHGRASLAALVGDIPGDLHAYLLRHDSTQGPFPGTVNETATKAGSILNINGHEMPILPFQSAEDLAWHRRGIEIVVDCEPRALRHRGGNDHLRADARCVVVTGLPPTPR